MERVIVIGGGLSGLAAAYRLQQAGFEVTVLEKSHRTGGCAATIERAGYVADVGCNLINDSFTRYLSLATELGLSSKVHSANTAVDFVRNGTVVGIDPARKWSLVRSSLLSPRAKLAVARGAGRLYPKLRKLDAYSLTKVADSDDHGTGVEFCRRYFNDEVGQYAVDPIVRSYAGVGLHKASGLSVLGALAVGLEPVKAIEGGMKVVPQELTERLHVITDAEVTKIDDDGRHVQVRHASATGDEVQLEADYCVVAIAFHAATNIWPALAQAAPGLTDKLHDVGLITVSLGYDAPPPSDAYALLVPTCESKEVLGGFFEQNKSPDRAPSGKTLFTLFTDASVTPQFMPKSDEEIIKWAGDYADGLYPSLRGKRDLAMVVRWPHTGYVPFPGYWQEIANTRKNLPQGRIHVTSTLFGSGGIERAVLGGERAAKRLVQQSQSVVGSR